MLFVLQKNGYTMTARVHTLTGSPPNGSVCVVCKKPGDASDLVTHTGYKVKCIFHRFCYINSVSMISGRCLGCDVDLLMEGLDTR